MNTTALKMTPLFKTLNETEIENILQELNITESRFEKGDILAFQDEACNRLIMLLSGSVKAEMSDPSGKVIKIEDILAPNPLAILFLFGSENRFPVQITAIENSTALVIPKQSVLKMLGMNEIVLKNYLDISANFAARLSKKLHLMSFRTIRQKLAMYIIDLRKISNTNTVEFDRTKTALAEYFGVSRQSLERELSNMQADNLIEIDKKQITINNVDQLVQLVYF